MLGSGVPQLQDDVAHERPVVREWLSFLLLGRGWDLGPGTWERDRFPELPGGDGPAGHRVVAEALHLIPRPQVFEMRQHLTERGAAEARFHLRPGRRVPGDGRGYLVSRDRTL